MGNFNFSESKKVVHETNVDMDAVKLLGNAWYLGAHFDVSFENINEKAVINISTNIDAAKCDLQKLAKDFCLDVDSEGGSVNLVLKALHSDFDKEVVTKYMCNTNLHACSARQLPSEVLEYCAQGVADVKLISHNGYNFLYQATFENGKIIFDLEPTIGTLSILEAFWCKSYTITIHI